MKETWTFEDFLASVGEKDLACVQELHDALTARGCKTEVKLAKSGYVVSYRLDNKTIANYVFRKKGLVARIYANHIAQYMDVLETLPDGMARTIQAAPPCKRLLDPNACNPRCSMGYDFVLRGERHQKCRNSAFMFLLDEESWPHVRELLFREAACG